MIQKVLRVGKSAAVTIPKKSLDDLGLRIGDQVSVEIDSRTRSMVIKPFVKIDSELIDWTEKFIEEYRPALEALAKK